MSGRGSFHLHDGSPPGNPLKIKSMNAGAIRSTTNYCRCIAALLGIAAGGGLAGSAHADPLDRDLLLYYDFNDRLHPAIDRSGNGNEGTVRGAEWVPAGIGGGALHLRGPQDSVKTSDAKMPMNDAPRSISCWISLDRLRQSIWTDLIYYGTRDRNQMAIMSIDWRHGRDCPDFSQWGGRLPV